MSAVHTPTLSTDQVATALRQIDDPLALLVGLFVHSPVAFQVYRADGHCLVTNAAFRQLFGSEPPPEYNVLRDEIAEANGVLELIRRAFDGETIRLPPVWYDARELRQVQIVEGKRVAVEATFFPLRDADAAIRHVAIAFKEVTTERTLREEAERERDLLGLIVTQSGDGIIVADRDGVLRMFNPEAERQHGRPFEPVEMTLWAQTYGLLDIDGKPIATEALALYRALQGETVASARWLVERPDGTRRILSGTATPLRDAAGAPVGAVLVTRDDTAQIEDERRLRFQATILENVPDSVIVTDMAGKIIEWNRGAEQIFGYTASEVLGHTPTLLYPNADAAKFGADLAAVARGADHIGEWEGRRKDGASVWVEVRTTRLLDADGAHAGFIGVGKAITERKRAEEERARLHAERKQALEMAEAASRAKDEFLAMLGHELRNPLSPIVIALDLMKAQNGGHATREQQVIARQVDHLLRLVDDLLDVSRITRGKVELKAATFELHEAITRAVEMAEPAIERRRHTLTADVPRLDLPVHGDAARLAQVFSNLLTNAAKYTEPGGNIVLRARRDGDELVASVRDDGVGIDRDLLPHVFDLFTQGPRSSDRAQGGLGIGLTLVRNLVQMHGGTVEARSEGRGKGTEIIIRLPVADESRQRADGSAEALTAIRRTRVARRILVVDDNADAADMMAEAFRSAGHDVRVAYDSPSAISTVEQFPCDVAFLDLGLPVIDGFELGRRLRETLGPKAALVAVTGYGQDHDRAKTHASGFDAHLVKPVPIAQLLERVEQLRNPS